MTLDVPTELNFDCPPGQYRASCYDHMEIIKPSGKGQQKYIRLRFKIDGLSTEQKTMLVCKNFIPSLKKGGELRETLDGWLGEEFISNNSTNKKFNFEALHHTKADVVVSHIHNGQPKPYVCLESVQPVAVFAGEQI
jgi:hypothetical protein